MLALPLRPPPNLTPGTESISCDAVFSLPFPWGPRQASRPGLNPSLVTLSFEHDKRLQKISHTYLSGEKLSVFFDTGGLALAIRTTTSGVALTKRASGALGPAHFGAVGLVSEKQAGVFRSEEGSLWGGKGRPCQNMPPYLQYSRLSSRLVLLSGPKWRVRSGAFDAAWCSCNGPWPHQAWRKMAWPLARCGLIEIQCIRRGTRFPCAHRRAPREASPAADRFCRV